MASFIISTFGYFSNSFYNEKYVSLSCVASTSIKFCCFFNISHIILINSYNNLSLPEICCRFSSGMYLSLEISTKFSPVSAIMTCIASSYSAEFFHLLVALSRVLFPIKLTHNFPAETLKYCVGVQGGQSYLMGRRCLFSPGLVTLLVMVSQ